MIATVPDWPDDEEVIERGEWRVIRTPHWTFDSEEFKDPVIGEVRQRKDFRSPPINPGKRIKSQKKKRRK